ncbi:Alpha/Beta hydrolase protein [Amylostereum chailletii]|nr:Alpha/Beta hydrolase protein [Amylostereum chailletii]
MFSAPRQPHVAALLVATVASCVQALAFDASPQTTLNGTTYTGAYQAGEDLEFYGGIPYGHAGRFEPATLHLNADSPFSETLSIDDLSEDCLSLNIIRPKQSSNATSLPVLLWIFGGAYVQGDSSLYNGTSIVTRSLARDTPVVFVSINYRLGPWGFPQGIAATKKGALNLGLKDQILAMQWVQQNIAAFGGDPTKVTLFGQSAGAGSIQLHHYNPAVSDLFRASIMQSPSTVPYYNGTVREATWANLSIAAGCATLSISRNFECLRALDAATFYNATLPFFATQGAQIRGGDYAFVPNIDGELITDSPAALTTSGSFFHKPAILGTNHDEGTTFAPFGLDTALDFLAFLTANTNPLAGVHLLTALPSVLALYPDDPDSYSPAAANDGFPNGRQFTRVAAVAGDAGFLEPMRSFAQVASNFSAEAPIYTYRFSAEESVTNATLGVTHGVELPFIFDIGANPSEEFQALADTLITTWISFAVELAPVVPLSGQEQAWPKYTQPNGTVLEIVGGDVKTQTINDTFEIARTDFMAANPIVFAH